jgi:hypothetical protein
VCLPLPGSSAAVPPAAAAAADPSSNAGIAEQQSGVAGWFSLPVADTPSECAATLPSQVPQQQQQQQQLPQEQKGGELGWQALPGFSSQQTAVPPAAAAAEVAPSDVWLELPGLQPGVVESGLEQQQQQQHWPPQATAGDGVDMLSADDLTTQHSQQQQQPTGPRRSCSVSSVTTDGDAQLHSDDVSGSPAASSVRQLELACAHKAEVGAALMAAGEMLARPSAVGVPTTAVPTRQEFQAQHVIGQEQQELDQASHWSLPVQQQQQHHQHPSSSSTLARYAAYLDESAARGITPPGLTAASAKALRDNLRQAAALSGQQLQSHGLAPHQQQQQQQQLGFLGNYPESGFGLGAAAGLCCEDMVASNALDVFVGSSLGHIRRKLAGKTSAALWGPARAAQQHGVAIDQSGWAGQQQQQQQQRQHQASEAGHGSMPSARARSGYQYTTLEDTLAFIRRHRAGGMGAVGQR